MLKKLGLVIGFIIACALIVFFTILPSIVDDRLNAVSPHTPYKVSDEAKALHNTLFIADLHADPTLWNRDFRKKHQTGHMDLPRMLEGNLGLQVFTTVTKSPRGQNYSRNSRDAFDNITLLAVAQRWPIRSWNNLTERALFQASKITSLAQKEPGSFRLVLTKKDLEALYEAKKRGEKIAGGVIGTEGSHALEGELKNVDLLYSAGFRMMSLHHFFDNRLGGSLHGTSKAGLSEFGKKVVKKIDTMPIILDVSHSSEQVVKDVLSIVKSPVIVSHTGTYGHCASPRNISDQLMREIAQKGGLIGIGFWNAICDYSPKGIAKAIIAAIDLVGENHVALGSDFDGSVRTKIDVSELSVITHELLESGTEVNTIKKVMGENVYRLFYEQLPM